MDTEKQNDITLEQGFALLDEITARLEDPDLTLEERFEQYRKGMDLVKLCTEKIDLVEKKLKMISENGTEKETDETI